MNTETKDREGERESINIQTKEEGKKRMVVPRDSNKQNINGWKDRATYSTQNDGVRLRKYEESRDLQKNAISDNAQIETKKRNRLKERNRERERQRERQPKVAFDRFFMWERFRSLSCFNFWVCEWAEIDLILSRDSFDNNSNSTTNNNLINPNNFF